MMYFIPGCDVRKNHPIAVRNACMYFNEKNIPEGPCCRKDLSVLKKGDVLITECTQCTLIFGERVPEAKQMTIYEYLLNEPGFAWPDYHGREMVLQDCWRMRDHSAMHAAIRRCLENMNIHAAELEHNREKADFCGVWLNNPAPADCIEKAPKTFAMLEQHRHLLGPLQQKEKMETYVRGLPQKETIVYCNGCEKGLRLGDGQPVHMAELLFNSHME